MEKPNGRPESRWVDVDAVDSEYGSVVGICDLRVPQKTVFGLARQLLTDAATQMEYCVRWDDCEC
jgi:hypothetical protein